MRRHVVALAVLVAVCFVYGRSAVAQAVPEGSNGRQPQVLRQTASVSSIAITSDPGADGYYTRGDVVEVTVTFDESLTVSTSGGTPSLALTVGDEMRLAEYDRGSGTAALVFDHQLRSALNPQDVADLSAGNLGLSATAGEEDEDGMSVEAGTIALNGGTIRNAANDDADLAYSGLTAQSGHKVDSVSPGLLLDPIVNGAALTLVYREVFDTSVSPAASVFTVTVGSGARTVSGFSVTGDTVSLTLDPAVDHGDDVTIAVAYTTSLRDSAGNAANRIHGTTVTNETPSASDPAADPMGPSVTGIALGSTPGSDGIYAGGDDVDVTVTFDDSVTVDTTGGEPSLRLMVGHLARRAVYEGGSGTATLTFRYTVAEGYPARAAIFLNNHSSRGLAVGDEDVDGLSIEAGRIALNGATIQNATNNNAAPAHPELPVQSGHRVDGVGPTMRGRSQLDGDMLTVTFIEAVDGTSIPAPADFSVDGSRVDHLRIVTGVDVNGAVVTLTLDTPVENNDRVWVSYVPGATPLRDLVGNEALEVRSSYLENNTPPPPPPVIDPDAANVQTVTIASAPGADQTYAGGDAIDVTLTFDRDVTVDTTNGTPSIKLAVGSRPREAFYTAGSGSSALAFSYTVVLGAEAFFVKFLKLLGRPAPPIGDEDDDGLSVAEGVIALNDGVIEDTTNRAVNTPYTELAIQSGHKVDGIRPLIHGTGSSVDGVTLTLAYSEALDPSAQDADGFVVGIAGGERCFSVAAISISGSTATLTLAAAVGPGEQVSVGYTPGASPLRDLVGNPALEDAVGVTNRTTTGSGGNGNACTAPPPDPGGGGGPPPPSGGGGGGGGGGGDGGGDGGGGDDEDEDDGGNGDGGDGGGTQPPPSSGPPKAAFSLSANCNEDLCRALTGVAVTFEDTSSGGARSRRWDFGDGEGSRNRRIDRAWSEPGFYLVTLTVTDGERESTASRRFLVEASDPAGTCEADLQRRCLQDSRYSVAVEWWKADGESGPGRVVREGTDDSALFWFFAPDNWEVLIKVLDGCAVNGNVWVFGASTTDLGYRIAVTDTKTGAVKEYRNEPGLPAPAITDSEAFDACAP